jgi:hypothetical protein
VANGPRSPRVRVRQQQFSLDNANTYLFNVDDLPTPDGTHLTAAGYVSLGERYYNGLTTPPPEITLVVSDNFAGTTVDTEFNWTVNSGATISYNDSLIYTNNHSGTITFDTGRNNISNFSVTNGEIWCRMKFSWTDPTNGGQAMGGIMMYVDANNYVAVLSDSASAGGNKVKTRKRLSATNTENSTNVDNGSEFKMYYNCSNGNYQIWNWNGSSWTSMETGTLVALSGSSNVKMKVSVNDSASFTGGDLFIFEEFDMTIADFTTRRP